MGLLCTPVAAPAQEVESTQSSDPQVERAIEARRELEELLEALTPDQRAQFERRWAELLREPGGKVAPGSAPPLDESPPPGRGVADADAEPSPPISELEPRELPAPGFETNAEGTAPGIAGRELERTAEEAEARSRTEPASDAAPAPEPPRPPVEDLPLPDPSPALEDPTPPGPSIEPSQPEPAAHACNTLGILDSNGDGVVTGADRFWRYLGLWVDDGDGVLEDAEVKSLFKHRIRKVSARLYSYTTAKEADGGVWLEERIYFDLPARGRARGALTLNAGGMARSGDSWVEDGDGRKLDGLIAIERGTAVVTAEDGRHLLLCP